MMYSVLRRRTKSFEEKAPKRSFFAKKRICPIMREWVLPFLGEKK